METADECGRCRRRRGLQTSLAETRANEGINGMHAATLRQRRFHWRDEGPVPIIAWSFLSGCMCAFSNPLLDKRDLRRIQRPAFVRHLRDLSVSPRDDLHKKVGQGGAMFAAGAGSSGGVELELGFLRGRTVAFHAVLLQQRFDLRGVVHRRMAGGSAEQE